MYMNFYQRMVILVFFLNNYWPVDGKDVKIFSFGAKSLKFPPVDDGRANILNPGFASNFQSILFIKKMFESKNEKKL